MPRVISVSALQRCCRVASGCVLKAGGVPSPGFRFSGGIAGARPHWHHQCRGNPFLHTRDGIEHPATNPHEGRTTAGGVPVAERLGRDQESGGKIVCRDVARQDVPGGEAALNVHCEALEAAAGDARHGLEIGGRRKGALLPGGAIGHLWQISGNRASRRSLSAVRLGKDTEIVAQNNPRVSRPQNFRVQPRNPSDCNWLHEVQWRH